MTGVFEGQTSQNDRRVRAYDACHFVMFELQTRLSFCDVQTFQMERLDLRQAWSVRHGLWTIELVLGALH